MVGKFSAVAIAGFMACTAFSGAAYAQDNWSYSGNNGPANWHQLSPANSVCRTGQQQSPINIEGTDPVIMHRLVTDYQVAPINLKNRGHSIGMTYTPGSIMRVGARFYTLNGMTFHTPAEHTVAGQSYPMSIQSWHRGPDGSVAIIETLVKEGRENAAIKEIWTHLPLESGQTSKIDAVLINARDLMPTDKAYFRYVGSLSTPPCTEGVQWYVLKQPIELSKQQIDLVRGIVGGNSARPVQRRNNRIILDARPQ
ncbi:MAG: carbonate dehydratase [Kordiimonadales bacterium]|nr:MAG: carbonate dehydratase [Kordiimonadales bacterium]